MDIMDKFLISANDSLIFYIGFDTMSDNNMCLCYLCSEISSNAIE